MPPNDLVVDEACTGCENPCEEHKAFPGSLHIDTYSSLLGTVKSYGRHILIATGQSDWPKKIEDDATSVAGAISRAQASQSSFLRNLITNTSLVTQYSTIPNACDVIVLPDNLLVSNVTVENAQLFFDTFIAKPLPETPLDPASFNLEQIHVRTNPYASLVLICSHKKRDKRCGVTAPILAQEFDNVLRSKDIDEGEGGTAVLMVSHIGGHKFAGNVICYTHQGTRGIWYGRVRSCHCQSIVEETILGGKVIMELYRGAMDHSFDLASKSKHASTSW
ncbi:Sucraseferredoxin-like protein [Radiomyces spectabilis]|uniref:Sucraseferredoxin-like protein n=1 Tax=Radiomyces spectabilis TaxID=64574 RepID=UPI00221FAA36|nr:Sucraseferredoxin-like protein [Radiomyces spectabilis]KAI8391750.1 Sucraseferredoxin-like protein [Radiomyces spectabilis]